MRRTGTAVLCVRFVLSLQRSIGPGRIALKIVKDARHALDPGLDRSRRLP